MMTGPHAALEQPSAWVTRFAPLIGAGEVLDLACGAGRHARFLRARGCRVLAVDRDAAALGTLARDGIATRQVDLEREESDSELAWPFDPDCFAAIVVTNYLHRPLFAHIIESLAPG